MNWLFKRWYYVGIFLVLALAFSYYQTSKNATEFITTSIKAQVESRQLFETGQKIRQGYSLFLAAITLRDDHLLEKSTVLIENALREDSLHHFDTLLAREFEKVVKKMKLLQQTNFNQITQKDIAILADQIETFHSVLIKNEQDKWATIIKNNLSLSRAQETNNRILKYSLILSIISILAIILMITLKEKIQAQYQNKSLLQDSLFKSLTDCVVYCQRHGDIISMNQSAQTILKLKPTDLTCLKIQDLLPQLFDKYGITYTKNNNPLLNGLQGQDVHKQTVGCFINSNFFWFSLNIHPVYESSKNEFETVLISFVDLTEQIKALDLISDQQKSLQETSKMSSLGVMAACIAHEINNPLSVLKIHAEMIKLNVTAKIIDPEFLIDSAKKIDDTITRIGKIISGVKMHSRDTSGDPPQSCNIKDIIEDTLEFSHYKILKENINIIIKEELNQEITCIPAQISQVLVNLIKNSIDAVRELSEKWIEIEVDKNDKSVVLKLTDSGSGIPLEVQAKIFDPFYTTKKAGQGTGLGLAISKGIIDKHKGRLYIDNECPNTRFVMELPL